jgi:hypothetical protein
MLLAEQLTEKAVVMNSVGSALVHIIPPAYAIIQKLRQKSRIGLF